MSFILKSILHKVVEQALSEGVTEQKLSDLGVNQILNNDSKYAPSELLFEVYELSEHIVKPGFAIRVAEKMDLDDYDLLGLAWKTSCSPKDMFVRCERFFNLMGDTQRYKLIVEGETGSIFMYRNAQRRGMEISNEGSLVATQTVLTKIVGKDIQPVLVTYAHPAPSDASSYMEFFDCEVLFGQQSNKIVYRSEDLDTLSLKADRSLNKFLMDRLKEKAEDNEVNSDKFLKDTGSLIKDALPGGIPKAYDIGKQLGMSARTLNRRLSIKNTSFRELLQNTQLKLSTHLLTSTHETISEIAFQTGFSEQSAFNRAFKRWTGQAPLEYRKKHSAPPFDLKR